MATKRRPVPAGDAQPSVSADFDLLFAQMPYGCAVGEVIVDDAGMPADVRLLAMNRAFTELTGLTLPGRAVAALLPAAQQPWPQICASVLDNGQPAGFECADAARGSLLQVHVMRVGDGRVAVLMHEAGPPAAGNAPEDDGDEMRTTFERAAIGITHTSSDGVFLRVNRKFADMLGYADHEICGKRVLDLTHPDDCHLGAAAFRQLATGRIPAFTVEKRYLRRDGSAVWVRVTVTAVRSGAPLRAPYNVTVVEDITPHKLAEEALRRDRSLLQAILDNSAVLISAKDLQGNLLLANRALTDNVLFLQPEFVGRNVFELFPHDVAAALWDNDKKALAAGRAIRAEEAVRHKDGSWHTYLTVKFPLRYLDSGEPFGVCAISTDISEQKDIELERERLLDQLQVSATNADRSRAQLEAVFQSINDGIAVFDMDGNLIMFNSALVQINGFSRASSLPRHLRSHAQVLELALPDGRPLSLDQWPISRVLQGESLHDWELRVRRRDTGQNWFFSYSGAPVLDELGNQVAAAIVTHDITERKRMDQLRQETERRLQMAVEIANLGFWEWDLGTRQIYFSPQWKMHLGYQDHELPNDAAEWRARLHPDEREQVMQRLSSYLAQPIDDYRVEYRLRHRDGGYRWVVAQAITLGHGDGRSPRLVGIQLDVTEQHMAEQRVREAAQHDPLTGLPNRALLFDYANHILAAAARSHSRGAFLFIDLDRFKPVNDLYGHEIGDRLLQEVARRLTACVRQEDVVGRIGGDEFVIVLPHVGESARAATVAEHVLDVLSRPFAVGALDLSISASVGISHFPQHGSDVDTLIHAADLAMYQTKQNGRGNFHVYTHELSSRADAASSIEARLKHALQANGLAVHYQPVVDMHSGRVVGAEALMRLSCDDGIHIGPDRFVPVAEASGLIGRLGEWLVGEVCRQHAQWRAQGLPPVTVALNVSPLQFRQRGFGDRLQDIVQQSCIDPSLIQIEVTESTVMDNIEDAVQTLRRIRACGIRVALDDFGTGYSSLSHLSNLPLDKLKVDQSFVQRLEHDVASRAITSAIIALGRTLNLEVVGEGIESQEAFAYLQASGCDQAQGFLISPPLPGEHFAQWYQAQLLQETGR